MMDRTKQLEEENKKLQELLDAAVKRADSLQQEVDDIIDDIMFIPITMDTPNER